MIDCRIASIAEIPTGWKQCRFKFLFKTRSGITFTKAQIEEKGESVISYGQIHSKDNNGVTVNPALVRFIPRALTEGHEEALAYDGDFIFADTSEDLEGCGNCICIDTEEPIYAGYHTFIAKKCHSECDRYLAYLFSCSSWRHQIRSMVNGIKVYSITQSIMKDVTIILPSLEEQLAIVSYLDECCAKMEEAITNHKRLIQKLDEYRKAVIVKAITEGVRGDRKMKASGANWIDSIPAGWDIVPLKSMFRFGKGLSITKADLKETGNQVISYGQIHSKSNRGVSVRPEFIRYVNDEAIEDNALVPTNGFVFADTSEDLEGCGNCVYNDISSPIYGGYHTIVLRPSKPANNKYLGYLFKTDTWRHQIRDALTDVKLFSISQKVLKNTSVIVPPADEQIEIVSFLDRKCASIDSAQGIHAQLITKLEEYKKSIINNAVTGKIKC